MQNTLSKTSLAFLFLATSLNAQSFNEECGTKLTQENIEFIRKNEWFYNGKNNLMNHPKYGNLLNSTFLLPVTLHVIRTSAGTGGIGASQQTQGITDLNTYFTGTGIQFYQAGSTHYINSDVYYSIDNDAERNTVRTANNVANTINLYVASYAQGSCGISSFTFSGVQGIVFDDDCYGVTSNPSTVPHEVGHYFELFHTHETALGSELVNGSNCSISGDLLCDTPADPNLSSVVSVYPFCTYTGTATDGNGASYSPDTHNQMSYSQKRCRDSFSAEQIERMLAALVYLRNDELLVSPTISVNTTSISKTLSTGSSTSQTVNISSTPTSSNLNWVATVSGASGPTATNQKTNNELNGSGGPDSFGYTWKDSNAPGGPAYVWNSISGTGTAIGNDWTDGNKDEGFLQTAIGFNFPFYGGTYNTVFISTNGFLTFSFYSAVTGTYTNPTIPTNDAVDNVISAFWDDLDGATGGEVYYQTSGSDFIVQFDAWPTYGGGSTKTFQYVLSSDGTIKFYYNTMNGTNSSTTVGIENHNGSAGIQVIKNASYVTNSLAVEFTNPLSWLVVNPGSGSIEEVANQNTSVEINTTGLATGTYTATVNISSNDDTNPTETISITLTVTNPPPSSDDSDTQSVSGNGTVNFVGDVSGGILATLTNEGAGDLGNVTITVDDDAGGSYGGVTILDRHFTVTSENPIAPGGAVLLEFHVTQAELDAAGISFADLVPYDCDFTPCQGGFPTSSAAISNTPPNNTGIGKATPPSSNSNSSDVVVAGWFTSFSPFVLGDQNDEPLPVTLSGFEAKQVEKSVLLTWKTESEVNNQGFRLYRSTSETGNYLKIADFRTNPELVGQANSSISKTYRFIDFEVELEKTYFYKLADVDFDNVETLHKAIPISLKSADTKPTEVFDYKLFQNHPNPFNPTTEIEFSIQKAGFVSLEIFNILGQKVKSLVSEEKEAGNYNVFWDGNDENGKVVSSGIYFYTIKAGNFSDKKKMVFLK